MTTIRLLFEDDSVKLDARELHGTERLGESMRLSFEAFATEPVDGAKVIGGVATVIFEEAGGARMARGVVTSFSSIATAQARQGRRYRLEIRSSLSLLALTRRSRVFQKMTIPNVVKAVLEASGWPAAAIVQRLGASHEARRYLCQYDETDEAFIRRICEDEGLYFHLRATADAETFVLEDTSHSAAAPLDEPLVISDNTGLSAGSLTARRVVVERRRAVGKVTLRDYNRKNPAVELEGVAEAGKDLEKSTEVYAAPGGFIDRGAGEARAKLRLEALRAEAVRVTFSTSAAALAPGDAIALECGPDYDRSPRPEGKYLVIAVEHRWRFGEDGERRVTCTPLDVPFRLARVTPRPRIDGVHHGIVTGPAGSEIHPDGDGCIFVHFLWDREGPTDEHSSLPVRALQSNLPGSMILPRVGWEVVVGFEDGDPDRPYVLGRLYNGKQLPPVALPANKTMTSIASSASPGGARSNRITFDDAAGRQHVKVDAGFSLTTDVANDKVAQTAKVEKATIKGSQTRTVGADEVICVNQAYIVHTGSQTASVGGKQDIFVKGNFSIDVGSESVVVGAALLEKVGNPVSGLKNLAVAAALAGVGAVGDKIGGLGGAIVSAGSSLAGLGWSAYSAATAAGAGPNAGRNAGIRGVLGIVTGFVPGADSGLASLTSLGLQFQWEKPPAGAGGAEGGGGAGAAAANNAAAAGPGPGHRNEKVGGAMSEMIGSSRAVVTPGDIKLQVSGAALTGVAASHSTKAVKVSARVLGAWTETVGSHHIKTSADVTRTAKAGVTTNVGGPLKQKAGGGYTIKSGGEITLKVGGSLKMTGGKVTFSVGDSTLSASPGGVLIKASTITIKGDTDQSGTSSHT
jgi:type VI secretion system secreted protein VgrG